VFDGPVGHDGAAAGACDTADIHSGMANVAVVAALGAAAREQSSPSLHSTQNVASVDLMNTASRHKLQATGHNCIELIMEGGRAGSVPQQEQHSGKACAPAIVAEAEAEEAAPVAHALIDTDSGVTVHPGAGVATVELFVRQTRALKRCLCSGLSIAPAAGGVKQVGIGDVAPCRICNASVVILRLAVHAHWPARQAGFCSKRDPQRVMIMAVRAIAEACACRHFRHGGTDRQKHRDIQDPAWSGGRLSSTAGASRRRSRNQHMRAKMNRTVAQVVIADACTEAGIGPIPDRQWHRAVVIRRRA
jgi:hypothetical protein